MEGRERVERTAQEFLLDVEYDEECEPCAEDGFGECQGHLYDEEAGSYLPFRASEVLEWQ